MGLKGFTVLPRGQVRGSIKSDQNGIERQEAYEHMPTNLAIKSDQNGIES